MPGLFDGSALESLEAINDRLRSAKITFHLSEVKGPVMDKLEKSHLVHDLTGEIFLSQHDAIKKICGTAYDKDMDYHL